MKKLLLFQVGIMQFGIDLPLISSIQPMQQINVAQPENENRLIPNFDGRETELYDLLSLFDKEAPSSVSDNQKIIMVEAGGILLGMIVDQVDRVIAVDSKRIELLSPIFNGPALICFQGVVKYDDRLLLIVNPEGIVSTKQNWLDFSDTGVKVPDRRQHPAAPRHPECGEDKQPQRLYSGQRSPGSKAQPIAIDTVNKVRSNV